MPAVTSVGNCEELKKYNFHEQSSPAVSLEVEQPFKSQKLKTYCILLTNCVFNHLASNSVVKGSITLFHKERFDVHIPL